MGIVSPLLGSYGSEQGINDQSSFLVVVSAGLPLLSLWKPQPSVGELSSRPDGSLTLDAEASVSVVPLDGCEGFFVPDDMVSSALGPSRFSLGKSNFGSSGLGGSLLEDSLLKVCSRPGKQGLSLTMSP